MSIETRLIRLLIGWLAAHYPFLLREAVVGEGMHIHKNPRKKVGK